MSDDIEAAFVAGAVVALRKRAVRQARIAADGTAVGARNAIIRQGEAAIADGLARVLNELADDFEAERAP
jgi:hypothetical protein